MITRFDHIAIAVHDWDAAVAHYGLLLGASAASFELGPVRAAVFQLSNARVLVQEPCESDSEYARALHALLCARGEGLAALAFGNDDANTCISQLRERGVSLVALEHDAARSSGASCAWELAPSVSRGLRLQIVERPGSALPAARSFAPADVHALDHVVLRTAAPEQAQALYAGDLGLRLALDREINGTRMLFFRTGGVTLEVISDAALGAADAYFGVAYRVFDLRAAHARLAAAGFELSDPRPGRKPGTHVFSVRGATCEVPTLFIRDPSRD